MSVPRGILPIVLSEQFPPAVIENVMLQINTRRNWREHDNSDVVYQYIIEEYKELLEEIYLDRNIAFLVASEIGDIFYLILKYSEMGGKPTPILVAIAEDCLDLCRITGLNPKECVTMKIFRNDLKYASLIMNNGFGFEQATGISKRMWNYQGGDAQFSQLWLDFGEEINHERSPQ